MGTVKAQAFVGMGSVPSRVIVMWSGSLNQIPSGWVLCNGQNGTPNLTNQFVIGAGNRYPVGRTGGQEQVTLTTQQMPIHNHSNGEFRYLLKSDGNQTMADSNWTVAEPNLAHQGQILNAGGNQPHENMPPYYALAFIMKL